jgi:hypothetical protein
MIGLDILFGKDNVHEESIVWRLEDRHGSGPYHGGHTYEQAPWRSQIEQRWYHPMPDTEPGIKKRYALMKKNEVLDDVFGFPSVVHFIMWFNKPHWRGQLERLGYRLIEYRAKNVAVGETQCIFNRKEATKLAEYAPTAFDSQYGKQWEYR